MTFERRDLPVGGHVLVSTSLERVGVLAAFTERTGGVSQGAFASLNLSYSSGDDAERIAENRKRLVEGLGCGPFALGGQIHGADLVEVTSRLAGAGFDGPEGVIPGCDGMWTDEPGRALAIATADCVPVVFAEEGGGGRIAGVHAGWRGVAAGIVGRAASLFDDPTRVRVAIGPAAGVCCYEVGPEVIEAVSAQVPGGAVVDERGGRHFLDLVASIRRILVPAGMREIEDAGLCTITERERFFSHRRDGPCGRQLAVAVRWQP